MPKPKSQKSKWKFRIYILVLIVPCFEIALRIVGAEPYQQIPFKIVSSPSNCITASEKMGFGLKPGKFDVRINEGLFYEVTHLSDSTRITRLNELDSVDAELGFFGCSYIYGMGVNDDENFPFLIQSNLDRSEVTNYGVPGYGTVQGFLQLKDLIATGNEPDLAVFCYANFHDHRNSLTPTFRSDLYMGFNRSSNEVNSQMRKGGVPYVITSDQELQIEHCSWNSIYSNWPLRESSATINFTQDFFEGIKERNIKSSENTIKLYGQIKELCDEAEVELIVVLLTPEQEGKDRLQEIEKLGIETCDVSINLHDTVYNNLPYDSHPNDKAHREYASKMMDLLHTKQYY